MADVKAIRDALKTNLQTIANLFAYDTMPSQPVVPCAIVTLAPGDDVTEMTMGGAVDIDFVVLVLVQKVVDSVAQDTLDTYLSAGSSSVDTALNSSATTNWDYVFTGNARNYGQYQFGAGDSATAYLGFEIPITVAAS